MLDALLDHFQRKSRLALSRLLSLAARGEALPALPVPPHPARVVALTGAGGVGKSSLTGKLLEPIRAAGLTVAVLACDPQSPVSGGALLGDRFRMPNRADDDGTFIRSLAATGGHGALARHLDAAISVLESFGFDLILVETVGAGQGDTAIHQLVDSVVLLLQPETGDDLQWEKAGLLEIADIVAIHKADLPGADRVEAQVLAAQNLSHGPHAPVVRVSARTGQGLDDLWQIIQQLPLRRARRDDPQRLLRLAQEMLLARFDPTSPIVTAWQRGELDDEQAARRILDGPS